MSNATVRTDASIGARVQSCRRNARHCNRASGPLMSATDPLTRLRAITGILAQRVPAVLTATTTLLESVLEATDRASATERMSTASVTLTAEQVLEAARPRCSGVRGRGRRPASPPRFARARPGRPGDQGRSSRCTGDTSSVSSASATSTPLEPTSPLEGSGSISSMSQPSSMAT